MLPILVRSLPIDEYASYSQVLLVTSTLYPIVSLGIGSGMIVFFNEDKKHNFNIVLNGIVNVTLIALLCYVCLFLFSSQLNELFNNQLVWHYLSFFFFSIILQISGDLLFNYLIFNEQSKSASFLVVISNMLRLGAIFLAIYYKKDVGYIFVFQLIALTLSVLIYFVLIYFTYLKSWYFQYNLSLNRKMIVVSVPLALTSIIGILLLQTDGYIINGFLGKIEFAYYRTGAIEIPFLSTIYASISLIFLPEFKKLVSQDEWSRVIELKRKLILNSAIIIYPFILVAIFFGEELITFYLGKDFLQSAIVFIMYNLILFIRVNDYSDILILNKKSHIIFLIYCFAFALNLILSLVLVQIWGMIGPLIATVSSIFVIAYLQLYFTTKILHTRIAYFCNLYRVLVILIFDILSINLLYAICYFFPDNNLLKIGFTALSFISLHFYSMYRLHFIDQSIIDKVKFIIQKYGFGKFFL